MKTLCQQVPCLRVEAKREEQGEAKHTAGQTAVARLPGGHLDQLCRQKALSHGAEGMGEDPGLPGQAQASQGSPCEKHREEDASQKQTSEP